MPCVGAANIIRTVVSLMPGKSRKVATLGFSSVLAENLVISVGLSTKGHRTSRKRKDREFRAEKRDPSHCFRVFTYINADIYQRRYVGGIKGFKVHGADFTCSVAAVQLFSKVQTDFWDDKVASNRQGAQEIFNGIVSDFSKRDLRPSDNHRFPRKEMSCLVK
jgi:hypothetical protein